MNIMALGICWSIKLMQVKIRCDRGGLKMDD